MQEPKFYIARILVLKPRCGIWSVYHKSIMLGIVCCQMYVLCVCVILCKLAVLLKCHVLYVIYTSDIGHHATWTTV